MILKLEVVREKSKVYGGGRHGRVLEGYSGR